METQEFSYPVSLRPSSELRPYERNARTHSRDQIEQLKTLIRLVGFTNPLLVDDAGIIAGHGRQISADEMWEAGETVYGPGKRQALPKGMLPCVDGNGMSPEERRAFIIADNQVAMNSDWDRRLLAGELHALKALNFDLAPLGFDNAQLVQFMAAPPSERNADEIPPQPPAVTQLGWTWQLGDHLLVCGDCMDPAVVALALDRLDPPALMVTDPPYGVNYDPAARSHLDKVERSTGRVAGDDCADWQAAWALFPGPTAYVWHACKHDHIVKAGLLACGFEWRATIMWNKPHYAIGRGDYHQQHEPCLYMVRKGKAGGWQGGRKQSTVWDIDNGTFQGGKRGPEDEKTNHGTQKPVECMKRPIENNSKAGQVVYDPFMGSGTTLIAAEMTHRICAGVDIDPAYVDLAVERWQRFTGRAATLLGDGRTFDAIAGR